MKRFVACWLAGFCSLALLLDGAMAQEPKVDPKAAEKKEDDKKPEEKKEEKKAEEEKKGPGIELDLSPMDAVVGKTTPFEVKVKRTDYAGQVDLILTGSVKEGDKDKTIFTVKDKIDKGKDSVKVDLPIPAKLKDDAKLTVKATGGALEATADVTLTKREPDPTGENTGTKSFIGTPPDKAAYPLTNLDAEKPDAKALGQNVTALSRWMGDSAGYLEKVADHAARTRVATNMMWVLITGFLVMFMQAGFAMVETGLTRAKNVAHTMAMNFMVYALGMLGFYAVGFALMFGGAGNANTGSTFHGAPLLTSPFTMEIMGKPFGLFGTEGFFLLGYSFDVGIMTLFLFQMVFMDTTATIPTGTMAERWKFFPFVIYALFISMIIYPIYGNWVWGGGWLAQLGTNFELGHGHVDFAGSSVVHMTGGVTALAGGLIIGARLGKYNKDGTVNALPAHNVPMYMVGTFILAFGWFGFNPGSAFNMGNDFIAARAAVNTMLAGAAGALTSMTYMWIVYKKPDPSFMCNGLLAGLVAITAPCAFLTPATSVLVGGVAGILVIWSALFWDKIAKVDDPVGAISVHGVNGAWGILALGLFADGTYGKGGWNNVFMVKDSITGKLYWLASAFDAKNLPEVMKGVNPDNVELMGVTGFFYGNPTQLYASLIGIAVNILWVFPVSFLFFYIVEKTIGNRTSAEVEIQGLDIPEMGVLGYINDDPKTPEGHLQHAGLDPRSAVVPTNGDKRFTVVVQGADSAAVTQTWSDLCQPSQAPPTKEFLLVYPHMTTLQGSRFRFRGGDPEVIRTSMERLLQSRLGGKSVRTTVEG